MAKPKSTKTSPELVQDELAVSSQRDKQVVALITVFEFALSFWLMAYNPLSHVIHLDTKAR